MLTQTEPSEAPSLTAAAASSTELPAPRGRAGLPRRTWGQEGAPRTTWGPEGAPRRTWGPEVAPRTTWGPQGAPRRTFASQRGQVEDWWCVETSDSLVTTTETIPRRRDVRPDFRYQPARRRSR